MKCEDLEVETRWVDAVLGELPGEQAGELEHHLDTCEVCRARLAETQRDLQLLGDLPPGPDVAEEVFLPPRPLEGWPRLPEALEKALLAIPGPETISKQRAAPIAEFSSRWDGLVTKSAPSRWLRGLLEWLTARPLVAGAVLGVALLLLLIPQWDRETWKGQEDGAAERLNRKTLRLELMLRAQTGGIRRAELQAISEGGLGAVVSRDSWLLPVLMTRTFDLSQAPWYVTVVWLEADGQAWIVTRSPQAAPLAHLPGTRSSFSTGNPFRLEDVRSGTVGRLFVLVTATPLEPQQVAEAASASRGPLSRAASLLSGKPLSGIAGYEGSMMVEVQ